MPPWQSILRQQTRAAYLVVALLATCSLCLGLPCQSGNWWDSIKDKCIPCTKCEDQLITLRPCQLHQDTICGTVHDLEIDWMLLTKTEPNWKERRKDKLNNGFERNNNLKNINNNLLKEETSWDWQAISLILAVLACLLFFSAATYISLQHMRHWRRMERRLDHDVEELSARLMAKLAEVQNVENGSFVIENPIADHHKMKPVKVHCVYLEKLLAGKDSVKSQTTRGNFYIEGNGSKG